jgi:hypothetical protein
VVSMTDPYGRILGFLDRSRYFSSKFFPSCTHEAEWTPFQTHYFSEKLVQPGIEPGPLDLQPGTLTARPQRWTTEMSTRNRKTLFLWSKVRPVRMTDNLAAICERLSVQHGTLNITQLYRPPRPVTGIALLLFTYLRT